jgi:hypothetical protein
MNEDTISRYLENDHCRLDGLLRRAALSSDAAGREALAEFRRRLLKHIAMEEKILLPAIQELRGGEPLPIAAQLRLEHGAIAALLVPTPRPAVIAALKAILTRHNQREEGEGGVYADCDRIANGERESILSRLRSAPEVPAAKHVDSPAVEASARRALTRAGFDPTLLDP